MHVCPRLSPSVLLETTTVSWRNLKAVLPLDCVALVLWAFYLFPHFLPRNLKVADQVQSIKWALVIHSSFSCKVRLVCFKMFSVCVDGAQLIECSLYTIIHKALGSIPPSTYTGGVLETEFKANLGYMRPCLKKQIWGSIYAIKL